MSSGRTSDLLMCVLGSGSSGNCTLLWAPRGVALVDAGLPPRTTARRMTGTGVSLTDVAAVCLTHLDRDHFNPYWAPQWVARGTRVHCHVSRVEDLLAIADCPGLEACLYPFDEPDPFPLLPGLSARGITLAHDREGSHGFVFQAEEGLAGRIGYATDLGRVPRELVERFCDVDVLAIESNYDPAMQVEKRAPGVPQASHHGRPRAPLQRAGLCRGATNFRPMRQDGPQASRACGAAASQPAVQLSDDHPPAFRHRRPDRAASDPCRAGIAYAVAASRPRAAARRRATRLGMGLKKGETPRFGPQIGSLPFLRVTRKKGRLPIGSAAGWSSTGLLGSWERGSAESRSWSRRRTSRPCPPSFECSRT